MSTNITLLDARGIAHFNDRNYLAAIDCYNEALKQTKNFVDAVPLLLKRCQARLRIQHFDAALADAAIVIDSSQDKPPPEKALFRASGALYGLQRWQESLDLLTHLVALYPSSKRTQRGISECEVHLREAAGHYDFADMLKEAIYKSSAPEMDRATYIGPIAVRDCAVKSHGRGLFTTKAVKAGELLLCEKAFAVVFPPFDANIPSSCTNRDEDDVKKMKEFSLKMRRRLVVKTLDVLDRNMSLAESFSDLYAGPEWKDEIDEESGLSILDESFVENRINFNNFGFPTLTYEYHYNISHKPELMPDDLCGSRGVWIHASYMNHSCFPMVRRSFIGDMMIFRAQQNIPADTELKFGYISALEELDERQKQLKNYGFDCDCQICEAEKGTSEENMKRRLAICGKIAEIFEEGAKNPLQMYTDLLDQIESTYVNPPRVEYRRAMITPLTNLITGCLTSDLPLEVIDLAQRFLIALGFEIEVTNSTFRVLQWGFIIDELVVSLVDMCEAYQIVGKMSLLRDVEEVAKTCYLIICGEDVTWEEIYGRYRKRTAKTRSGMDSGE